MTLFKDSLEHLYWILGKNFEPLESLGSFFNCTKGSVRFSTVFALLLRILCFITEVQCNKSFWGTFINLICCAKHCTALLAGKIILHNVCVQRQTTLWMFDDKTHWKRYKWQFKKKSPFVIFRSIALQCFSFLLPIRKDAKHCKTIGGKDQKLKRSQTV